MITSKYPMPPSQDAPAQIDVLSRREFLQLFGQEYASGQHVTFLGPTQRGKTTLSHQMLAQVISPERRAVLIALKPPSRDPVMGSAAKNLNLRIIEDYPPDWNFRDRKRNGYVVRPEHDMHNPKATNANLQRVSRNVLTHGYASKNELIIVVDETHIVQNTLRLKDELEAPLMRGAPVVAEWNLIQRGYYITYHAYGAPEWVLIYYDPDQTNQRRYGEIGGVDPKYVSQVVSQLRTKRGNDGKSTISEALCIRRSGPEMFIVSTD